MKKLFAIMLSVVMVFALAATASAADYKIAIITGTVTQGDEEYRAAEKLQNLYPDIVLTDTYPDNFSSEIEATKQKIVQFAFDPDVKAIIMCQAVPGTAAAFQEVREMRDDILLLAGVAQEAASAISPAADVILYGDEPAQGAQIVETAKKWGVDVIVHYSFPRHMAMELIVARHEQMTAAAAEAGIEFVDRTAPDPTAEAGATASQQFILEDVPAVMEEFAGKKVAFFTTNCGMQEPLQTAVLAQENAYYPQPCCPSPYHAFPASLEIGISDEAKGDPVIMLEEIAAVLKENNALDRFSTWPLPVNMAIIDAAFDYATNYLNGEFTEKTDRDQAYQSMLKAAEADELSFVNYVDSEGTVYDNFYMVMLQPVDFNDYVK